MPKLIEGIINDMRTEIDGMVKLTCPKCNARVFIWDNFCTNCGLQINKDNSIPKGQEFCPHCGRNLRFIKG